MSGEIVHVAVAVITNDNNQVLISKRDNNVHMGGYWEFPGGKLEHNESVAQALSRELNEELDITIESSRPFIQINHHYNDKSVFLDVYSVLSYSGDEKGNEGQVVQWKSITELEEKDFPAANRPIITALKLPERCLITGDFETMADYVSRLETAITNNIKLIQCRITKKLLHRFGEACIYEIINKSQSICEKQGVILMMNCPDEIDVSSCENIHLNSRKLKNCSKRPDVQLLSASCHDESELVQAVELGVDFVFLSPVHETHSHPDAKVMGWNSFSELVKKTNVPVYALGGVSETDLFDAWQAGAQGVAAISAFWDKR